MSLLTFLRPDRTAYAISERLAGTVSDSVGSSVQNHVIWATNDGAWWLFYCDSRNTNQIKTYRSKDGLTWTAGSSLIPASPGGVGTPLLGYGRNFGCVYKNIASNDIVHVSIDVTRSGTPSVISKQYTRGVISNGVIVWGTPGEIDLSTDGVSLMFPAGPGVCFDSTNLPVYGNNLFGLAEGSAQVTRASGIDLGTSWTPSLSPITQLLSKASYINSIALFDIGAGNVLALFENAASGDPNSMTNVSWAKWNGTSWA